MAQFTPSKKTIKDFNDGEEYLNRIDVVQADTINNLVEGLLYAQENGGSGGGGETVIDGTLMLTEGREGGKVLRENDYFLDVVDETGYSQTARILGMHYQTQEIDERNTIIIETKNIDKSQELIIHSQEIDERNRLKIGE